MVNAPYDKGQDWDLIVNKVRKSVIKKISRNLKVDISKDIITEEILTPLIIQSKTKSKNGFDRFSFFDYAKNTRNLSRPPRGSIPTKLELQRQSFNRFRIFHVFNDCHFHYIFFVDLLQ